MDVSIWVKWIVTIVATGILGASTIMLWNGTFPPPMTKVKAHPLLSTSLFIIGMTGLLVFGSEDLLKATVERFFP